MEPKTGRLMIDRGEEDPTPEWRLRMKCQRCGRIEAATYRVRSDLIDVKVCAACAEEARSLGIVVEALVQVTRS
jgi:hypothetical protein